MKENEPTIKKQSFLHGAAILAVGTLLVKIMGLLFKVPLNNIIGDDGFGYFNTAYDVYNVLLMISTTGLPVAMSRMISEAQTLENYAQIRKVYHTALYVFLGIGILGSLGMGLFSKQLSVLVTTNENSWACIAALSPSVLLICLVSAYRGFFQGQSNMTPTSVSQIYEALVRLIVGLGLAWLILKKTGSIVYAAGGAILGVTAGCLISAVYLHFRFRSCSAMLAQSGGKAKTTRRTMKELLSIAIPITLGSAGLQIINLFDVMIYMRRLTGALGWTDQMADSAKGIYNYCQTIFQLPCSFIPTISIAIIPAITSALTLNDEATARKTEETAVSTMSLIALPCAVGMAVLAEPIIRLLCTQYTEEKIALAGSMLAILAACVVFNSLVLLLNAIMQAHGDVTTPVINMLIGGVIKVIVNYFLVAVPSLNIVGAPIGTLVCYASITFLNLIFMRRSVKTRPAVLKNMLRPLGASLLMGAACWGSYRVLSTVVSQRVACLGAILAAVVVFAVVAAGLRCVTYDTCKMLPKGEKIAKILKLHEEN